MKMKNIFLTVLLVISNSVNSQTFDIINPEQNVGLSNWNIVTEMIYEDLMANRDIRAVSPKDLNNSVK